MSRTDREALVSIGLSSSGPLACVAIKSSSMTRSFATSLLQNLNGQIASRSKGSRPISHQVYLTGGFHDAAITYGHRCYAASVTTGRCNFDDHRHSVDCINHCATAQLSFSRAHVYRLSILNNLPSRYHKTSVTMESFSNFHTSAKDICVEEGHILAARLYDPLDKRSHYTSLDLNHCIGNIDGMCTLRLSCSAGL